MSTETLEVGTGALLTIATGTYLTESFDEFHHAAEVVMGQPIMTHQFASQRLSDDMRREVERQHPWLADPHLMDDFPNLDGKSRDECAQACREFVAAVSEEHGPRHLLTSPPETRHVPLTEGLPAKFGGSGS